MSFSSPPHDHLAQYAKERVFLPGIFLLIVGVINLLVGGYFLLSTTLVPREAFRAQAAATWDSYSPEQKERFKQAGYDKERFLELMERILPFFQGGSGLATLFAIVTLLGGVSMIRMRARGLAIAGSVMATIPCLSPLGCCLVGEGIGIWCLVVLFNSDVIAAFSANSRPGYYDDSERPSGPDEGMLS
jgi:hypothetical protein